MTVDRIKNIFIELPLVLKAVFAVNILFTLFLGIWRIVYENADALYFLGCVGSILVGMVGPLFIFHYGKNHFRIHLENPSELSLRSKYLLAATISTIFAVLWSVALVRDFVLHSLQRY